MAQVVRIGWIGVGVMGKSMCSHLLNAGYAATVYNRTAAKCAPLAELVCDILGALLPCLIDGEQSPNTWAFCELGLSDYVAACIFCLISFSSVDSASFVIETRKEEP
jgi:hypothetical protein